MGQELLELKWEKKPRLYFKATNSNGLTITRGSARKVFAYAVVIQVNRTKWLYGSWASTEALANKYAKGYSESNYTVEVVKAEVSSAKEVRQIKKQMAIKLEQIMSKGKNLGGNTNDNDNN